MKVFIIDNYDSFTYNLYQFVGEVLAKEVSLGNIDNYDIVVKRNDEVTVDEIVAENPDRIIISPGPGSPDDEAYFGVCAQVIKLLGQSTPLLGVCLGMQGIVHVFGGKVVKAPLPMHGKISPIHHTDTGVFEGIPDQLEVMRYHSLVADADSLPECLTVTASVGDESEGAHPAEAYEIMGVQHKQYPIQGIQFHPESFATEGGKELVRNFLLQ
jgi:anthranilate synthase component 2